MSVSGVNAATAATEKLHCDTLDTLVQTMQALHAAIPVLFLNPARFMCRACFASLCHRTLAGWRCSKLTLIQRTDACQWHQNTESSLESCSSTRSRSGRLDTSGCPSGPAPRPASQNARKHPALLATYRPLWDHGPLWALWALMGRVAPGASGIPEEQNQIPE